MVLLEQQIHLFSKGTITSPVQQLKLQIVVTFVSLIYSRWWFTWTSAVDAPWNDLNLYHNLQKYTAVYSSNSASALNALNHHLWYMSSEMVSLALFSNNVSKAELQYLAERLLALRPADKIALSQDRYGNGFGKPVSQRHHWLHKTWRFSDSWFTYRILTMDTSFLSEDVNNWPDQQSFCHQRQRLQLWTLSMTVRSMV